MKNRNRNMYNKLYQKRDAFNFHIFKSLFETLGTKAEMYHSFSPSEGNEAERLSAKSTMLPSMHIPETKFSIISLSVLADIVIKISVLNKKHVLTFLYPRA